MEALLAVELWMIVILIKGPYKIKGGSVSELDENKVLEEYGHTEDKNAPLDDQDAGEAGEITRSFKIMLIVMFVIGSLVFGGLYFSLVKGH